MGQLLPLRAIHYNRQRLPLIDDLVAPPYDVINEQERAAFAAASPYNIVALDLPRTPPDPYAAAGQLFAKWLAEGVLCQDQEEAFWLYEQTYRGPDGQLRTRRGFFGRIKVEPYNQGRVRPHERTHPGPKQDRLRLTRATRANLSPIFVLYSDPTAAVRSVLEPISHGLPFAELRDREGTVHRLWRGAGQEVTGEVVDRFGERELLIADGHHRYETALAYAREADPANGHDGPHRYVLACLVALEDPGLTVFPIHRLAAASASAGERLKQLLDERFQVVESDLPTLERRLQARAERFCLGLLEGAAHRGYWLEAKKGFALPAALAARSPAYQRLDSALVEEVLLREGLGLEADRLARLDGFGYARTVAEARAALAAGHYTHAFLLRATPVEQIAQIAAAGEFMPAKTTYFYPKLLTGLLINPLW